MKKKYRFLIEMWSEQPSVVEFTSEEYDEFKSLDLVGQVSLLESKCCVSYNIVDVDLTEVKEDV